PSKLDAQRTLLSEEEYCKRLQQLDARRGQLTCAAHSCEIIALQGPTSGSGSARNRFSYVLGDQRASIAPNVVLELSHSEGCELTCIAARCNGCEHDCR